MNGLHALALFCAGGLATPLADALSPEKHGVSRWIIRPTARAFCMFLGLAVAQAIGGCAAPRDDWSGIARETGKVVNRPSSWQYFDTSAQRIGPYDLTLSSHREALFGKHHDR